jgi:alanine-glyoxylate transaminase / serine-glyoxylate transaminase / serine-pyruvate transaminase
VNSLHPDSAPLLLGPGPSPVPERIRQAMARPTLGHLDPRFLELLDDVNARLRRVFGTGNATTFPVSGTGSAGMEASMVNLVEAGDTVIVGVNGVFGTRLAEVGRRLGATVVTVEAPWGEAVPEDALEEAARAHPEARLLAVVHAETSTGVHQPLERIGAHLRESDTLFVVDAVTSLGGVPVEVDARGIDVCYSGTQKCLGVPPGLAPITFSERAMERVRTRESPSASWYLDVALIAGYLGSGRRYHHTAPINMIYGLHEALLELEEEGLEARFARHRRVGRRLQSELADRGFTPFTAEGVRLPQLTAVHLPGGREEGDLRARLLRERGIEVGGGLGTAAGRIWRIGLMGYGAQDASVDALLEAVDALVPVEASA